MRPTLRTLSLFLVSVQLALSQTSVPSGNVSGTWTLPGSPYLVQGDITIPADSMLIIDPGVTVVFQGHYALIVQGSLRAIGTPADSIRFTVNDTTGFSNPDSVSGGWYGIRLINTPLSSDSTILAYCRLEYGKAVGAGYPDNTGGAVSIANFDKVRISSCLVAHSIAGGSLLPGGGGIALTGAGAVLERNLIADNRSTGQGGGILLNGARLRSTQNRFVGNSTTGPGGGVLIEGMCNLVFQGDSIVNNSCPSNGGGLFAYGQTQTTMDGVAFFANAAKWGGGLAVSSCTLSVHNCAFGNNTATMDGGAILASFSSVEIGGSWIGSNRTSSEGGGIYTYRSDLRLRSSMVVSNRAGTDSLTGLGGGIYTELGSLRVDSCVFLRDTAWISAGLRVYNSDLVADSVIIQENFTSSQIGGLYWYADSMYFGRPYAMTLSRVSFLRNKATNSSAGAFIAEPTGDTSLADVLIDRCEFTENSASVTPALAVSGTFKGLVISNTAFQRNTAGSRTSGLSFAGSAKGMVYNCLFAGNHTAPGTASVGAGLSMGAGSEVDIMNCTFAFNVAGSGSAMSVRGGAKARIMNTVFWKNAGKYIALASVSSVGGQLDVNYCSVQHGQDSIVVDSLSTLVWGAGMIDGDPVFKDTLGGDCHLLAGSPAIGAGIDSIEVEGVMLRAPVTDMEGLPRPSPNGTRPDLGAFEDQVTIPEGVARSATPDRPSRFALEQNYPNPFNPTTNIRYHLPASSSSVGQAGISDIGYVRLSVFDLLGREVAVLVNERKPAGTYTVEFDARNLASGVYFYRLSVGAIEQCKKLMLLK